MKVMLAAISAAALAGCVASSGSGGMRVVRASAGSDEIRWMIAATVANDPHFGGWSVIGAPKFSGARMSPGKAFGGLFGGADEQYCVSATMIVAGIPQPKSVQRGSSVATARVRPGYCAGQFPFPELEMVGARR
jgi:hypothetical protein